MIAIVIAVDSSFTTSLVLPVKLPTVALLDTEAAIQYVAHITRKLYLEVPFEWDSISPPILKMSDDL